MNAEYVRIGVAHSMVLSLLHSVMDTYVYKRNLTIQHDYYLALRLSATMGTQSTNTCTTCITGF